MNETYHMLFTAILRPRNSKKTTNLKKVLILAGVEPTPISAEVYKVRRDWRLRPLGHISDVDKEL